MDKQYERLCASNKKLSMQIGRYYTARQSIVEEINSRPYDSKIRAGLEIALKILDEQVDNGKSNQIQA